MIKNKALDIKIIFKAYLKTLKICQIHFKFSNRLSLYKIEQFSKNVLKNSYQICPKNPETWWKEQGKEK